MTNEYRVRIESKPSAFIAERFGAVSSLRMFAGFATEEEAHAFVITVRAKPVQPGWTKTYRVEKVG